VNEYAADIHVVASWANVLSEVTVIADTGQTATQAPQPVQSPELISGEERPPRAGRKRIAAVSQLSSQTRHATPLVSTQAWEMMAFRAQAWVASGSKQSSPHACRQAPQKVQAELVKSTMGKPA
jgi:hypothetical protein